MATIPIFTAGDDAVEATKVTRTVRKARPRAVNREQFRKGFNDQFANSLAYLAN